MTGRRQIKKASNSKENLIQIQIDIKKLVDDAIKAWQSDYMQEISVLKAELVELKDSQKFICGQYDDLKQDNDNLLLTNKQQENEIKRLQTNSQLVAEKKAKESEKLDALEQYGRRQNLEFTGIPETQGEDTNEFIIEVTKHFGVEIIKDQISTSYRLPVRRTHHDKDSTKTSPPPIIARFVNRDIRNEIYAKEKLIRDLDFNKFSVYGIKSLFINENLTQQRKKLFWLAKQKARLAEFKYIWTSNGNIFVRRSEETVAIGIKLEKDLSLIG